MKRVALGLTLFLLLFLFPAYAATVPKAGSVCSKQGVTKTFQGKKFTCIKSGKKLVWGKGISVKKPTPTPKSIPTPIATPTPSPSFSAKVTSLTAVSNLLAIWQGEFREDLVLTFDHDTTLNSSTNNNTAVDLYQIKLKHVGPNAPLNAEPKYFELRSFDKTKLQKQWTLNRDENASLFVFADQLEVTVVAKDSLNRTESSAVTITSPLYASPLLNQTITVDSIKGGYRISFITDPKILLLEVWENLTSDNPDIGWYRVSQRDGKTNPIEQYVLTTQSRSVKIRVYDRNNRFKESNTIESDK